MLHEIFSNFIYSKENASSEKRKSGSQPHLQDIVHFSEEKAIFPASICPPVFNPTQAISVDGILENQIADSRLS
jgi:hypothetical protein